MSRIGTALRLFFRALSDAEFAARGARLLAGGEQPAPALAAAAPVRPAPPPAAASARSDALSLLSMLQREGRLIDFLKEDISGYADAQVGAAVRDVHRDCAALLERAFAVRPLRQEAEGASIDVPPSFDATSTRLVGNVTGQGPWKGALRHPGWRATKLELPQWTGSPSSINVISPAEVEL